MTNLELKYHSLKLNDLKIKFKDEIKSKSILTLSPKLVQKSNTIDVSYDETFLSIKYMKIIKRVNGWPDEIKTLHIEKIALFNISKMDIEVKEEIS
jgi:hypothetical protein